MKKLFWVLFVALFVEVYAYALPVPVQKYPTGLKLPSRWQEMVKFQAASERADFRALPLELDLRELATAIKNQMSCGSCWAFASVEVFESLLKRLLGKEVVLSPQELVSCDRQNSGCGGGWVSQYQVSPGNTYESEFPYKGMDLACKKGTSHDYHLSAWTFLGDRTSRPRAMDVKQALVDHGPLWVGVCGSAGGFQGYHGGVYKGPAQCTLNHAVVLEGYVEQGGKNLDGSQNTGAGYWLLRNSWGTGWGEKGRMRIQFGSNSVASVAAYAELP